MATTLLNNATNLNHFGQSVSKLETFVPNSKSKTAVKKGFAIAGGSVLHRHFSARWKFSSPNKV